eukprot:m.90580 g.90580  ORF g.90580 m.90580 type:complete len:91 (-) comp14884_c0_seq15:2713-2985(-)
MTASIHHILNHVLPFVIQDLVPLSIHWPSFNVAVVAAAPASLPLPGSLNAKQPKFSPGYSRATANKGALDTQDKQERKDGKVNERDHKNQ